MCAWCRFRDPGACEPKTDLPGPGSSQTPASQAQKSSQNQGQRSSQGLPGPAKSCQGCEVLPGLARVCQCLPGPAQACQGLPRPARACQGLPNLFGCPETGMRLWPGYRSLLPGHRIMRPGHRGSYGAVSLSSGASSGSSSESPSSEPELGLRLQPFARNRAHAYAGWLRVYSERFLEVSAGADGGWNPLPSRHLDPWRAWGVREAVQDPKRSLRASLDPRPCAALWDRARHSLRLYPLHVCVHCLVLKFCLSKCLLLATCLGRALSRHR